MAFSETDALFCYDYPVVDKHVNKYSVVLNTMHVKDADLYLFESHFIFVVDINITHCTNHSDGVSTKQYLDTVLNSM